MSDQNAALFDKLDGFYVTKSEHDWLERRFSNMTEKEKILFQGAMELEKPQEIGHVMRIASQLDCYDLFYGAGDEAALGKFVMESMVCALSLLLFLVGAAFALTLGNLFLVPVLAVGMMFVPFWFIRLTANHYKKNIAAELETALSIITTAYLRNEDIQTAVEENIDYLNPPVRSVFVEFLTRIKLVDPDVDAALQDMGTKIDNAVFREWVAALLTCRHDRGLKTILTPIVAKLSDMRIVNGELENLVFEPRKEFITMQVLVIGNIPLLYWLNQDWYDVLMHTPLGQALLAIIAAVMFISTAAVIKLTQPIEYRR